MPGHLIHVGFPKAGSTALSAWFEAHPQLVYAPNGIGGYYHAFEIGARAAAAGPGTDAPLWQVTSAEALSMPRVSDAPSMTHDVLSRRAVPLAEARRQVCAILKRLCPGATILIVTRGFKSAARSGYSQYVRTGGRLKPGEALAERFEVDTQYDYDAVIDLYTRAFGPDNLLVLPYELLRDDPAAFARELEERLGVEASPPIASLNVSLSPAAIQWYRRLSVVVAGVCRLFGRRVGERLYALYVAQIAGDRLRAPARLLGRLLPGLSGAVEVTDGDVEHMRGRASTLAERPLYALYAREYLNERPPTGQSS
jgi:hypothetical protein